MNKLLSCVLKAMLLNDFVDCYYSHMVVLYFTVPCGLAAQQRNKFA